MKLILSDKVFSEVTTVSHRYFKDNRGTFSKRFDTRNSEFEDFIKIDQVNIVSNIAAGTWRGLHFQQKPYGEKKLISVLTGEIIDFFVNVNSDSSLYLHYNFYRVNSESNFIIMIPQEYAHGYLTLQKETSVLYLHDGQYETKFESGLNVDSLEIDFEVIFGQKINVISERDLGLPNIGT